MHSNIIDTAIPGAPCASGSGSSIETRIDKIERRLPGGEIDVVFILSNEGQSPATARINGEEFPRRKEETLQELAERALQQYRMQHKPANTISVLIMDCRP
jgi:folate-dependent phosphoribosylglycinamide formyltransferase PurN